MSNYRRLISYIYAYEGGIKGKNIGFVKIEARSGQCKIQVNVKKVYVGNSDMGVYLLAGNDQILLGKIFVRNGAGEFRAAVSAKDVENSGWSMEECYGLTIHSVEDSWQAYTTIWEDAVAQAAQLQPDQPNESDAVEHAAEVDLCEVTAESAEMNTMLKMPDTIIPAEVKKAEQTKRRSSIVEEIEAEIQAQSQMEEPNMPVGQTHPAMEGKPYHRLTPAMEGKPYQQMTPAMQGKPYHRLTPAMEGKPYQQMTPTMEGKPYQQMTPAMEGETNQQMTPTMSAEPSQSDQPDQPSQLTQPSQPIQPTQPDQSDQPIQPILTPEQRMEVEDGRLLELLEQEEMETSQPGRLWRHFRKTYPKMDAFDYANGCEILTIKPQDIGLLPRETWTYGNNSFLLHGYYSYRYLILVKLNNPQGEARYLLGVPGHYYSNEKYMASMFGFPNFVLSKQQPAGDVRFGYWYTDINMGNQ